MALPIETGTYGIDTWHSQLSFAITHLGISIVRGIFTEYTGLLTVGADLASTSTSITAQMASVSTGNPGRDGHLQGADFFDSANHPAMTFSSTAITETGPNQYTLTGELSIRGVTKSESFDVAFNGSGVFPMDQSTHFGFVAKGKISRSDYGITYGVGMVSDNVDLVIDAQFVKPASA